MSNIEYKINNGILTVNIINNKTIAKNFPYKPNTLAMNIDKYDDWEIVQVIPGGQGQNDMVILMKEDYPAKATIELENAANEQIIQELLKRLGKE